MKLLSLKSYLQNFYATTPLSWAQLSYQKVRLVVAITGIAFANILMFSQLGLLTMLTEGSTKLHKQLAGDLLLLSSFKPTLLRRSSFPRAYLYQAEAVDGVISASPVYRSWSKWVNPQFLSDTNTQKKERPSSEWVRIIAFNPNDRNIFKLPEINQQLVKLNAPDSILFDRLSQPSLGQVPELLATQKELATLVNNRRTSVVGLFSLGSTLDEMGNIIMSDWNYAQRNSNRSLNQVTIGIITLEKGVDVATVRSRLRQHLPQDVKIFTHEELIQREKQFVNSLPQGIVLQFGTIVGFVVGIIILYQILYADVSDHLSEYATLKAMGYGERSLLMVVLQEAIILGVMGFIPGFLGSLGIYQLLVTLTRIPLVMRVDVAVQVFILTIIMCSISGIFATGKLRSADPADVF